MQSAWKLVVRLSPGVESNSIRIISRNLTSIHSRVPYLPSSTSRLHNNNVNRNLLLGARCFSSRSSGSNLPPMNNQIRFPQVRVVYDNPDETGKQAWKILSRLEALEFANEMGKDLVLVNGNSDPPVCKFDDRSRMLKEMIDKRKIPKVKPKVIKEILIGVGIDPHDLEIKINKITEFLEDGHQVKISTLIKRGDKRHGIIDLQKLSLQVIEALEPVVLSVHHLRSPVTSKTEFIFNPKRKPKPTEPLPTENA